MRESPVSTTSLAAAAEELGRSVRAVLRMWKVLPFDSPYKRLAVRETRTWLDRATAKAAGSGGDLAQATLALELEVCDLVRAEAALEVAETIRAVRGKGNIRSVARALGIGVGTLSPLENARGNLPSEETARKIDIALGTSISRIVVRAQGRCAALKEAHRTRRRTPGSSDARQRARVRTAVEAVTADSGLAEIVLKMTEVPQHARRTIEKVVSDLVEAFLTPPE